jgi:hypothetical protein
MSRNKAQQKQGVEEKLRGFSPRANYTETGRPPLSAKLEPIFTVTGCYVVSVTDPYGSIFGYYENSTGGRGSTLVLLTSPIQLNTKERAPGILDGPRARRGENILLEN